jgi:hypothetical protein
MRPLVGGFVLLSACSTDAPLVHGPTFDAAFAPDTSGGDAAVADVAAAEGAPDVATDSPACTATTVLLAGNGGSLSGGSSLGSQAPTMGAIAGNVGDRIAIAPQGTGFVAALRSATGALLSSTFTSKWSDATSVSGAQTVDAPALATIGTTVHVVYHDTSFKFEHRKYASSWDVADDNVGGSGVSQAFGPSAPALAAASASLVFAQAGDNSLVYDITWISSWQPPDQPTGASIQKTLPPSMVALTGGSQDLLLVYLRNADYKIMSVARASGAWGAPVLLDATAYSNDPLALAALPGGRALLVYRGSDQKPYFSVYDVAKTPVWSVPRALLASNPTVASTPSVAAGVCGDDAEVAYASSTGGAEIAHYSGGSFAGPTVVSGTAGSTYVAIATR